MSKELRRLLADPAFLRSIHITTSTTIPAPPSSSASATAASHEDAITGGSNHLLHLILLELAPAFVHVVSLKGDFLYVGPSVRRVLGYEPEEMVGTSISKYAHPEDVVPLMRELKESSAMGTAVPTTANGEFSHAAPHSAGKPRSVDLLFRAKTKMGRYVWVECRGRLHVEPGKGRKAIILSGRAREMMNLKWEDVNRAGGLAKGVRVRVPPAALQVQEVKPKDGKQHQQQAWRTVDQEVWGMLSGEGKETMVFASVGRGVEDVLGWTEAELLGRSVLEVVLDEGAANVIGGFVATMRAYQKQQRLPSLRALGLADAGRVKKVRAPLRRKDGGVADVWFIVYRADPDTEENEESGSGSGGMVDERREREMTIAPAPLVYQIRLVDAATVVAGADSVVSLPSMAKSAASASPANRPSPSSSTTSSSSSSLAGAVQPSPLSPISPSSTMAASPPSTTAATSSTATTMPSVDMFEELAIAKGSSWQYELQQLRFANVRLQEELSALEAAEAGGAGAGAGGAEASVSPPRRVSDPPPPVSTVQPQDMDMGIPSPPTGYSPTGYSYADASSSFAAYMDQTLPSPHLFMQRAPLPPPQQQHQQPPLSHQYPPPPLPPPTTTAYAPQHQQIQSHSQSPYSIQAMPGVAPLPSLQRQHQLPLPQQQRRLPQRAVPPLPRHQHSMPMAPLPMVQQDWNGVMTTAPLGSVSGYVGVNSGSGLKRPWDAVEP
ncbi:unnamed protein product [Cyclocybe aegerita]|uniref:PAS domain-containing protein n=1 Tax=Cyclocybe aegerita TaxID=1973307 RepID=A0A8S0VZB0_CYCAE|nr:unnamed protein product [Cyclocybe aegerita]